MSESTAAHVRNENWTAWVGEPTADVSDGKDRGRKTASLATVLLLWLSALTLAVSGYFTTVPGEDGVPGWQLLGLAALALVVVGLTLVFSKRRRLVGIAAIFGSVMVVPWVLAGQARDAAESDGAVTIVIALVVVAIISGSGVAPPRRQRLSVLLILVAVVWISLAMGIADLLGTDLGAFHFLNERYLFGIPQLRGLMGHPNTLALLASLAAVVSLQFTRSAAGSIRVYAVIAIALLGPTAAIIVVVMAQSRIGLLSLLVGMTLVLLPLRGSKGSAWSWVLLAILYLASFGTLILSSVTSITFHGRATAWDAAIYIFRANPLLGAGPDAFADLPGWMTPDWVPGHAHSQVLQTASLSGLVGLALLALAAGTAAWIAIRARDFDHVWSFGVVGVFATFAAVEPVLGVAAVPVTYLPVVLASCVIGSSSFWVTATREVSG